MIIYLGTDHRGFKIKEVLKKDLLKQGYKVVDFGAHLYDKNDDYPDFIKPVARAVAKSPKTSRGIVLGGSGQGEAIVANRVKGIRAVVYYGNKINIITLSREHNDANILSFGAMFVREAEAKKVVKRWLGTKFSGDARHKRRIRKID